LLKNREKIAVIFGDKSYSFSELLKSVSACAKLINTKKSEKVLIFGDNSPEWIITFYAAWKNENIAIPIDTFSTPEEIAYILDDSTPELAFVGDGKDDIFQEALKLSKHQPKLLHASELANLDLEENATDSIEAKENEQTALIIYTSGTTGSPKGVMLSYKNLLTNITAVTEKEQILIGKHNGIILLPLHHIFPLLGSMVAPLRDGSTLYICPSLKPEDILKTFAEAKAGFFIGVPRLYDTLAKGIKDKIDASIVARLFFGIASVLNSKKFSRFIFKAVHEKFGGKMEHLVAGGAALPLETGKIFKTLGFNVLEGFGMTEAAPMISVPSPRNWKLGTCGQVLPNCEIKIENGEVLAKGDNIMQGYYNRPEETAAVLKDGWLHTGDLGEICKDGFLKITGRIKEIIVTPNGKNINPAEIESKLISKFPIIADAGVFLHNNTMQVLLFPQMAELRDKAVENLNTLLKEAVAEYNQTASPSKRLMKFHTLSEELPRTRLGKLQRFRFVDLIPENADAQYKGDEPQGETYQMLKKFIIRETGKFPAPNSHFEIDLGMDSLTRISLLAYIEVVLGVKVGEELLSEYSNLNSLSEHVDSLKDKNSLSEKIVSWKEIIMNAEPFKLPKSTWLHSFLNGISKTFIYTYFRFKGRGSENVPNEPCIITPNHQSSFDSFFVAAIMKRKAFKNTYILAKEKHLRKRWMRYVANRNNVIIMDINADLKESIQKMAQVLREGKNLMIFPEGTRSIDGNMLSFKDIFAILSCELQVPVVPVAINGAYKAMPSGRKWPRLQTNISVDFLKPIYPSINDSYEKFRDRVKNSIMKNVSENK